MSQNFGSINSKTKKQVEILRLITLVFFLKRELRVSNTSALSRKFNELGSQIEHKREWETALRYGYTPRSTILNSAFIIYPKAEKLFNYKLWTALDTSYSTEEHWLILYPMLSPEAKQLLHRYLGLNFKSRSTKYGIGKLFKFLSLSCDETVSCLLVLYRKALQESDKESENILTVLYNALAIFFIEEPFLTLRKLYIAYIAAFITQTNDKTLNKWLKEKDQLIQKLRSLSNKPHQIFMKSEQKTLQNIKFIKESIIEKSTQGEYFGIFVFYFNFLCNFQLTKIVPDLSYLSNKIKPPDTIEPKTPLSFIVKKGWFDK